MLTQTAGENVSPMKLTPDNSILVLMDHQTGLTPAVKTIDQETYRKNVLALVETAKIFNLPAVITASGTEGPGGPVWPGIRATLPGAPIIDRATVNPWDDESFVASIRKAGRKNLIMAGVTADTCLAFSALSAISEGYEVYAVMDASGSSCTLAEQAAIAGMSRAGIVTTTWVPVAAAMQSHLLGESDCVSCKLMGHRLGPYGYLLNKYL